MNILFGNLLWMGWNTVLAGLSWVLMLLSLTRPFGWQKTFLVGLAILFWPNALYVFTDLIHFPRQWFKLTSPTRYWLLFEYGLLLAAGLALHLAVLKLLLQSHLHPLIHRLKLIDWQEKALQIIIFISLHGLVAFGVTLGRFARTNSWYLFTHPTRIITDCWEILTNFDHLQFLLVFWLLGVGLSLGAWVCWWVSRLFVEEGY